MPYSELRKCHICAIKNLMNKISILPLLFWYLPSAVIIVCWCRQRVRGSTLHNMRVEERNSLIRQKGKWSWGFPLKTRRDYTGARSGSTIAGCSLNGLLNRALSLMFSLLFAKTFPRKKSHKHPEKSHQRCGWELHKLHTNVNTTSYTSTWPNHLLDSPHCHDY